MRITFEYFTFVALDSDFGAIYAFKDDIFKQVSHQPERLNPEDHIVEDNDMVCDSLNTVNNETVEQEKTDR